MTLPFHPRPGDPDADHLNTFLDAMRSGTRAPDAVSPESTEAAALADAADQFRGLVRRADSPAAAYLDRHPLQDHWEDIMSTAFPAAPQHVADGETFAPSAPVSNRTRSSVTPQAPHRHNAWLSAAIVVVLLLGTIGGAWWFGPGGSGSDGDSRTRLAAVTPADSTPAAIWPEPLTPDEAPWIAAISPEECIAEPLPYEEYAEAITTDPGEVNRSYEIVGPAAPEDDEAGVVTLRGWFACGDTGNIPKVRAHFTDRGLFYLGATADNVDTWDHMMYARMEIGLQWSEWAEEEGVYPLALVTGIEPDWVSAREMWSQAEGRVVFLDEWDSTWAYWEWRYDPDNAYMLADGRMMIHGTVIYWAEDPMVQERGLAKEPNVIVMAYILEEVDGQWLIDEQNIQICFNESCNQIPDAMVTPAASPVATPVD